MADFNCQNMSNNHLKKMSSTQPAYKLLSDIKKLLKKEFEEEFEYFLIPGNVIEANKLIFDAITQSYAKITNQYPHTLITKSKLFDYATYLQDVRLCKVVEVSKDINTFQFQVFDKDFKCNTCLMSMPFSCPDTGAVQITNNISDICKKYKTILHIDFTNEVKCLRLNPQSLGIGTFTFDFSKIGALHGISVLGIDKKLLSGYHLSHICDGEFNSGTLDAALSILKLNYKERNNHNDYFASLKEKVESKFRCYDSAPIYLPNVITVPNLALTDETIFVSRNLFGTKLIFNPDNTHEDVDLFLSSSSQSSQERRTKSKNKDDKSCRSKSGNSESRSRDGRNSRSRDGRSSRSRDGRSSRSRGLSKSQQKN